MRAHDHHEDTEVLLKLWEAALGQPASIRNEALLQASCDSVAPARTLGECNARLIALHTRLFGHEIDLLSHCPACHAVAQFTIGGDALAAQLQPLPDTAPPYRLVALGHAIEFRLPDAADVAMASAIDDDTDRNAMQFTQRLLERCVLACELEGHHVPTAQLPEPVREALSQRMEALDPGASVSFALDCPQCAAQWQAPLDVGDMLWRKVRAAAEHVLLDIDVLARAYGWAEREVLRLSPLRRAAYLQMVAGG
jgi:hypothetical protein